MMRQMKRWAAGLLAAGMALSLCACGPRERAEPAPSPAPSAAPTQSPSPAPEESGLAICLGGEPATLDPTLVRRRVDVSILSHLFEGLMRWAPSDETDDGLARAQLTYGQAQSYDRVENADGTVTYTFHLRPDAKWSDGKAVTAHDFVYAWQRLVTPATGAYYADMIDCVVNAAEVSSGAKEPSELAVWAVDDATFAVTVHDVPWFLQLCAFPAAFPVRQDMVDKNPDQWSYSLDTLVTNGMYRLSAWDHGAQLVLEPSEQYDAAAAGTAPALTFAFSADDSAILSAYQAGNLDFAVCAPAGQVPELMDKGDMDDADYVGTYYLTFQTRKAPFDDARVRKAFTLAVDRERLVEEVTASGESPADGYVPSGISDADGPTGDDFREEGGDYYDVDADDYKDNCDQARDLLAQAGYPGGAGFPAVEYLYNTGERHKAVAQALQEMWQKELGVTVTLVDQEWSVFLQTRREGGYSIARGSWTADYDDPMSFLELWRTGATGNDAQYADADYDRLLTDAAAAPNAKERMMLLHQAENLLIGRDYALCPLYFYTKPYLLRDGVEGVCYTPLGYFFFHDATKK